jgi:hypothetical protein
MVHSPWLHAPMRALVHFASPLILCAGMLACGHDRIAAPAPGHIEIAGGNAQHGVPGQPLALPIAVVVRDGSGDAVSDVHVSWRADDGGTIAPGESITDATGRATATWTLGTSRDAHRARAIATGYSVAQFSATSPAAVELPFDVIVPLTLETYDRSGQTVHPDFVTTGPEWTHASDYLFITPYPNGNAQLENPSVYESLDFLNWSAPGGVSNPIAAPQEGYFSDPDALFEPDRNELWLYFRQVTQANVVRLTTSRDGVTWTTPVEVARAPNHQLISPSVVRRGPNEWLMWAVNGNVGCTGADATVELRRSMNGTVWSNAEPVALSQPGVFPWHIDVEWIPSRGEYWALYNGKTAGTCTTGAVYLATSPDGVHWRTYPSPVLAQGAIPELQDIVYRSTFSFDAAADAVTLWYSGARFNSSNYIWRSAVQRRRRADLFATINAPTPLTASKAIAASALRLPQPLDFP